MVVHDDVLFAVIKTARYVGPDEVIALGQLVLLTGPGFMVSASYGEARLKREVLEFQRATAPGGHDHLSRRR